MEWYWIVLISCTALNFVLAFGGLITADKDFGTRGKFIVGLFALPMILFISAFLCLFAPINLIAILINYRK